MVFRIFVEKKPGLDIEAQGIKNELVSQLGVSGITGLRLITRYDVEGIDADLFARCVQDVFSDPATDFTYSELPQGDFILAVESLPGQFDQRADSAAECIQFAGQCERPMVRSANIYLINGAVAPEQRAAIEKYLINPVEARQAALELPQTLKVVYPSPDSVETLWGFTALGDDALAALVANYGLAMDADDLACCRDYFRAEDRDPTITELRVLDTYWSDHCRHTTFLTAIDEAVIEDPKVAESYQLYLKLKAETGRGNKPVTLMDIATMGMRTLKARGLLPGLDESEEVNACTVKITVDNGGTPEDWLLLFKNETHNHPTEIEPFGGASTCLGGGIRDPLSGRGYVYQAMRVSGAGDPLTPINETLPGKLPQRKLVTLAAAGYSSYGNQIGGATGQVTEIYHPGYVAKRMELGALVGAAPAENVIRETPVPGDVVILLGGKTGRDGCGGATSSSKAHATDSSETCGAEVQKGNPSLERRIVRLFRNPEASRLIRRCNDFGAGGVSVAIGELAGGLSINLDVVPTKYDGLDGTELAISESQERMAVVIAAADAARFAALARAENLDSTIVAEVTAQQRMVMQWKGKVIVDLSREFLNTNGAQKHARAAVAPLPQPACPPPAGQDFGDKLAALMSDLNACSQKGLAERFDSTVGAATLLMPFGGRYQLTPAQLMAAKLPVMGETTTASGMAFGFDPFISEQNPYDGAYLAVVESLAKLTAGGFPLTNAYLSFQEYFERLRDIPERWGKPLASLLGALQAQIDLGVASIGGKDSMSGSFEQLDVPPALLSFAVSTGEVNQVTSPEFKRAGSRVCWLRPRYNGLLPDPASFKEIAAQVEMLIASGAALSVYTPARGGAAQALFLMGVGNRLGFQLSSTVDPDTLFAPAFGSFIIELAGEQDIGTRLGVTTEEYTFKAGGEIISLAAIQELWESKLEPVFPYRAPSSDNPVPVLNFNIPDESRRTPKLGVARPRVLIPVFPGANGEYDIIRAFRRAGAEPQTFILCNRTPKDVAESAAAFARLINASQMIAIPGGFSGGDEPDGGAKLISAFFRGPEIAEAIARLLEQRDGLMLGIGSGFQALVKLGLLPNGQIAPARPDGPALTINTVGRYQSMLVRTRVASNLSPWLRHEPVGAVHLVAIGHGEGRFVADPATLSQLAKQGQIASQYVDPDGNPTLDVRYNPNGSLLAIEGITSPDGRILGKMGHTERSGDGLYKNVSGEKYQRLFEGGVDYFKA